MKLCTIVELYDRILYYIIIMNLYNWFYDDSHLYSKRIPNDKLCKGYQPLHNCCCEQCKSYYNNITPKTENVHFSKYCPCNACKRELKYLNDGDKKYCICIDKHCSFQHIKQKEINILGFKLYLKIY